MMPFNDRLRLGLNTHMVQPPLESLLAQFDAHFPARLEDGRYILRTRIKLKLDVVYGRQPMTFDEGHFPDSSITSHDDSDIRWLSSAFRKENGIVEYDL